MFTFRRPTDDDVRELLARQAGQPWSYPFVGQTRETSPTIPGWQVDRHRVQLGHGEATFAAACEAIRAWKMFPPEMTRVYGNELPPQPGQVVAVLYRARPIPLWMLFPARVVYVVDECLGSGVREHPDRADIARQMRFGFAYGTVPNHPERGEERFLVEWDARDDSVWYDLVAVSRPGHWLARVGYLYARYEQARFRRLSGLAMQRAVHERLRGDAQEHARCGGTPIG